jgi:hypothetical protein
MPLRLLPLLFFGSVALLLVLTEHVGQRFYVSSDYDPQVLSRSLYFVVLGIGFARRRTWFFRFCLLVWPIQLFTVSAFALTMPADVDPGADADLVVYSTTEVALILVQIGLLVAMPICLLLPAARAGLAKGGAGGRFDDVILGLFVLVGITFAGLRGAEAERALAAAAATADDLAAEAMRAISIRDGTPADLASPRAAACRPARHAVAAATALGHAAATPEARAIARGVALRSSAEAWPKDRAFAGEHVLLEESALGSAPIEARSQADTT